jgi:protein-disulfide isomerase-like protein with CxxC motif
VLDVLHFSDPACPWAYSASPALAVLRWRYADGLRWRHVMIGLTERGEQYVARGYTPLRTARGYRSFRARGMPFSTAVHPRVSGTSRSCRAVVAVRMHEPARELEAFRALQFGWFTSGRAMDDDEGIGAALRRMEGLDVDSVLAALDEPEVVAAYERDRAEARTAAGSATEFQGKAANTDGAVRYTAPSLVLTASDGRTLEAGGFQPLEAYDVCIANLDASLPRREPPEDPAPLLAEFPVGLTTREVAACLAPGNAAPDDEAAEDALIALVAEGRARREPLGNDALWRPAG